MSKHTSSRGVSPSVAMRASRSLRASLRGWVGRAVLAATLGAATLSASASLGVGELAGTMAPLARTTSHVGMASVGIRPLCNAGMWGC